MWESLIGAAGSILGGGIGAFGGMSNNAANNANSWAMANFNAQQAQQNRDWQERMSNTAYQRATADMRAAGINPVLAYKQGGSTTPSGSTASGSAAHTENAMEALGHGVSSASQLGTRMAELEQTKATTSNLETQAALNSQLVQKAKADTANSAFTAEKTLAETRAITQGNINAGIQEESHRHGVTSAAGQARMITEQADKMAKYGSSWPAHLADTAERVARRLFGGITNPAQGPFSHLPAHASPTARQRSYGGYDDWSGPHRSSTHIYRDGPFKPPTSLRLPGRD